MVFLNYKEAINFTQFIWKLKKETSSLNLTTG